MFNPCYPAVKFVGAVVARPVRRIVRAVAGPAPPRPRAAAAAAPSPKPQPALECLQKPGALPAGPGAAAPLARAATPAAAGLGTAMGTALGTGLGAFAAVGAAAGLAMGGTMLASALTSPSAPGMVPDTPAITDTLRTNRLIDTLLVGGSQVDAPVFGASPGPPLDLIAAAGGPGSSGPAPGSPTGSLPAAAIPPAAGTEAVSVPEPASLALLALGGLAAIWSRRRVA